MRRNRALLVHQIVSTSSPDGFASIHHLYSIMKRTIPFKPDLVEGLAFEGFRILPEKPGEAMGLYKLDSVKATGGRREPCRTCKLLINSPQLGFKPANFTDKF